jgi:hypothetical protein
MGSSSRGADRAIIAPSAPTGIDIVRGTPGCAMASDPG